MAKTGNNNITKYWQGGKETGSFTRCSWKCKMVQPFWKNGLEVPFKTKNGLAIHPAIALLDIYCKEIKNCFHAETCTWIFKGSFICNSQSWRLWKFPSMDKWINKLCYIHTTEYHSAMKRNKTIHTHTNLDDPQEHFTEKSTQKDTQSIIPCIGHLWNNIRIETKNRSVVGRG